jgi:hypothetical protein
MPALTIAEAWQTSKSILIPSDATQTQIEEIRRSFFVGAMATVRLLSEPIRSGSNTALLDALRTISDELQAEAGRRVRPPS